MVKKDSESSRNWRRKIKSVLVEHFGGVCHDCGEEYPPFVFDFDHRDPSEKEFNISVGGTNRPLSDLLIEAEKCDMVCASCHRFRTHRQTCPGCEFCGESEVPYYTDVIHRIKMFCTECGIQVTFGSLRCRACDDSDRRTKIQWPHTDDVVREVKETSFLAVGNRLGVSDNAVRKFLKRNGVDPKTIK